MLMEISQEHMKDIFDDMFNNNNTFFDDINIGTFEKDFKFPGQ